MTCNDRAAEIEHRRTQPRKTQQRRPSWSLQFSRDIATRPPCTSITKFLDHETKGRYGNNLQVYIRYERLQLKRIILHAGQHKTGTSAVQRFCADHREALLRLGYLYPATGLGNSGNHGRLVLQLLSRTASERNDARSQLEKELASNSDCDVIISAEYLSSILGREGSRSGIISLFQEYRRAVSIIIYVRSDVDLINASYAQNVKSFKVGESIKEVTKGRMDASLRNYQSYRTLARDPGIAMRFLPYDQQVRRHGATAWSTICFPKSACHPKTS